MALLANKLFCVKISAYQSLQKINYLKGADTGLGTTAAGATTAPRRKLEIFFQLSARDNQD